MATIAAYTAKKISPMLAVADIEETVAFYRDILGFSATMKSSKYAIVERDGQTIHFMKAASEEVMQCVRGHTEIYVEVSNIRTLWEHVRTFKDRYKNPRFIRPRLRHDRVPHRRPERLPGLCRRADARRKNKLIAVNLILADLTYCRFWR